MNQYLKQLFIIILSTLFCGMNGMEVEQNVIPMVQRKMVACALSKLLFVENEKILHVGFNCVDVIKQKTPGGQVYYTDKDTLGMIEKSGLGYDKILSFACWDVIVNPQKSFNDSARLLKENGQFCAVLPYYKSPYLKVHRETLMNGVWEDKYNKAGMIDFYGSKKAIEFLKEAGLNTNVQFFIIKKPFIFKTKEKLAAWIASCPEQLHLLDERYHEEFINDVVANYLKEYPFKDGNSVKLYLPYMIVIGNKS